MRRASEADFPLLESKAKTIGEWMKWAQGLIPAQEVEALAVEGLPLAMMLDRVHKDEKPLDMDDWQFVLKQLQIEPWQLEFDAAEPMVLEPSVLVTRADFPLTLMVRDFLDALVSRRHNGEPLAYILGRKQFYGRSFVVDEKVLIPRPETEVLIDLVKELDLPVRPRILDMGTGSGCIAITLALELPQAELMGVDISPYALDMAEQNDERLEGRVEWARSDLWSDVEVCDDGPFDVVVANLPYVDPNWDWLDRKALDREPDEALYAGDGGLELYADFLQGLKQKKNIPLQPERGRMVPRIEYLVMEADPCQHKRLIKMAQDTGWELLEKRGFGLAFRNATEEPFGDADWDDEEEDWNDDKDGWGDDESGWDDEDGWGGARHGAGWGADWDDEWGEGDELQF